MYEVFNFLSLICNFAELYILRGKLEVDVEDISEAKSELQKNH